MQYLTLRQTGEMLGIGPATLRRYITQGRLTGYALPGRRARLDAAEVARFLDPEFRRVERYLFRIRYGEHRPVEVWHAQVAHYVKQNRLGDAQ